MIYPSIEEDAILPSFDVNVNISFPYRFITVHLKNSLNVYEKKLKWNSSYKLEIKSIPNNSIVLRRFFAKRVSWLSFEFSFVKIFNKFGSANAGPSCKQTWNMNLY